MTPQAGTHAERLTFAGNWPTTLPGGVYWQTTNTQGLVLSGKGLVAAPGQVATAQPIWVVPDHTARVKWPVAPPSMLRPAPLAGVAKL